MVANRIALREEEGGGVGEWIGRAIDCVRVRATQHTHPAAPTTTSTSQRPGEAPKSQVLRGQEGMTHMHPREPPSYPTPHNLTSRTPSPAPVTSPAGGAGGAGGCTGPAALPAPAAPSPLPLAPEATCVVPPGGAGEGVAGVGTEGVAAADVAAAAVVGVAIGAGARGGGASADTSTHTSLWPPFQCATCRDTVKGGRAWASPRVQAWD